MAPPADPWPLERYRPLLRVQVRKLELDLRLRRRFDSSDLLQETMLRAHENLPQFSGETEAEFVRWLQEILGNVATDAVRKATAKKRDVGMERSLEAIVGGSTVLLAGQLAADDSSPSERLQRHEEELRLAAAIDRLPEDQRDVVIQRDLLGTPVGEIAEFLGKTEKAVAGLLFRGRRALREILEESG